MDGDLTGQRIEASDGQHYDVLRVHPDYGIQVQRVGGRKEWVPSLGSYTVVGDTATLAKRDHVERQAASAPPAASAPAGAAMSAEVLQRIEMNTDRTVELLEELLEVLKAGRGAAIRLPVEVEEDLLS